MRSVSILQSGDVVGKESNSARIACTEGEGLRIRLGRVSHDRGVIIIPTSLCSAVRNSATAAVAKTRKRPAASLEWISQGEPRQLRVTSVARQVTPRRMCCERGGDLVRQT
jgi:hypothetical protein